MPYQIQIAKKDLKDALQVVTNSMALSASDHSSHYLFRPVEGLDNRIEILTYSGKLFSSCPAICSNISNPEDRIPFTVSGKRLKTWLSAVDESAINFSYDNDTKIVTVSSKKGSQEFQSKDPDKFPSWDDQLKMMEEKSSLPAKELKNILTHAAKFAANSSLENTDPKFCVIEVHDGTLWSSDKRSVSLVKSDKLEYSQMRIFAGDVGSILKFLSTAHEESIKIFEYPLGVVFERSDGALFGETRYIEGFPKLDSIEEDPTRWFSLPKREMLSAIPFLTAGADEDDNRIIFKQDELVIPTLSDVFDESQISMMGNISNLNEIIEAAFDDFDIDGIENILPQWQEMAESHLKQCCANSPVSVSMMASTGNEKKLDIIPSSVMGEEPINFVLPVTSLVQAMSVWEGENVKFDVVKRENKNSGYIQFKERRNETLFIVGIPWLPLR